MYCNNCGKELDDDARFCKYCGKEMAKGDENQNNITNINESQEYINQQADNSTANLLCTISLFLTIGVPFVLRFIPGLQDFIDTIISICGMTGFVLMLVARVKYPKNVFAKVLMWIYIIIIIAYIVLMAALIIACGIACNNADFSGCY